MTVLCDEDVKYEIIFHRGDPAEDAACPYYAQIMTRASTAERAKAAAEELAQVFIFGRETWWRVLPEGEMRHDFEVQTSEGRGYARFGFALRAGEHHPPTGKITGWAKVA